MRASVRFSKEHNRPLLRTDCKRVFVPRESLVRAGVLLFSVLRTAYRFSRLLGNKRVTKEVTIW